MLTAVRAKRVLTMADKRPTACPGTRQEAFSDSPPEFQAPGGMLHDGVVVARDGVIEAVLPHHEFSARYGVTAVCLQDLGETTILPGLINCHTHLELAHLGGLATSGEGFPAWVGSLLRHMETPVTGAALDAAMGEMTASGTVHAADVNGRAPQAVYEAALRHDLGVDVQLEVFGYNFPDGFGPDDLWNRFLSGSAGELPAPVRKRHLTLAGHALYSTSPVALAFAKEWCRSHERHFSIHLAEHADEDTLLLTGQGRFRDMLGARVLPADYTAPGMRAVPYAAQLGLLDDRTLAVHCVHCTDEDIRLLRDHGVHVCLCPRSNAFIGVGKPPVAALLASGVNLCLGTDSIASNHDLNLWNEARLLRDEYGVGTLDLLRMCTVNAAHALGLEQTLGTLEPGRRFRYARVPDDFSAALPAFTPARPF